MHTPKEGLPEQHCDFYETPTILSRLILHQKYQSALRRLAKHPTEAQVWVCRVRLSPSDEDENLLSVATSSHAAAGTLEGAASSHHPFPKIYNPHAMTTHYTKSYYSFKQLPIHMACQNLALYTRKSSTKSPSLVRELQDLISKLITTYPLGCRFPDHRNRYPLHMCIHYGASVQEVTLLLTAAPSILNVKSDGRTPLEWCRVSNHRDKHKRIEKLLAKGVYFWSHVRTKAMNQDNGTVWTETKQKKQTKRTSPRPPKIRPISWSQLEQRVVLLEQLLAESMQQNYTLKRHLAKKTMHQVRDMTVESSHLSQQGLLYQNGRLRQQVMELQSQNKHYRDRLGALESSLYDLLWVNNHSQNSNLEVDDSEPVSSLTAPDLARELSQEFMTGLSPNKENRAPHTEAAVGQSGPKHNAVPFDEPPEVVVETVDENESLDSILEIAQEASGSKLSPEIVKAWKKIDMEEMKEFVVSADYNSDEDHQIATDHSSKGDDRDIVVTPLAF